MPYKCEDEVRAGAREFIARLESAGFEAAIEAGSVRDYMAKIVIQKDAAVSGRATLYYSPKKKAYTLHTGEVAEAAMAREIQSLWEGGSAGEGPEGVAVYVDGSWIDGAIGWGFLAVEEGKVLHEACGRVTGRNLKGMRQVGGELEAVYRAVAWCKERGLESVSFHYDYQGVASWATGAWKANKTGTREYTRFMKECGLSIRWVWVKSHSGDRWNEKADGLAKKGALTK